MKKILLCLLFLSIGAMSSVYAQNKRISGKVTSAEDGAPLPGVSVQVQGTTIGTQTSATGDYTLNIPASAQNLVFSAIGYAKTVVKIGAQSNYNVKLGLDAKQLAEVNIVVPFGTVKKETFTGSANVVSAKEIEKRPVTNVLNALAGAAPGITLSSANGQPGSSPSIRIRGIGSINASNNPLIIVDGVQYENALSNIASDDVESMSILKDAASTALYGAKAANGVVIITTKKGKRGNNQINVRVTQGYTAQAIPEYDKVDAFQYYPLVWQSIRNGLAYNGTAPLSLADASQIASGLKTRNANNLQTFGGRTYLDVSQTLGSLIVGGVYKASNNPFNVASNQIVDVNGNINPNAALRYDDLDWFKPLKQPSLRSNYGVNFNGGNEKSDYYVSADYTKEKGYIIKSDYQRLTLRLNVNSNPVKWFKTGANLSGTITKSNFAQDGAGSTAFVNPFFFARNLGPVYNVYAHDPTTGANLYDPVTGAKIYDTGGLTSLGVPSRAGSTAGRHILQETLLNNDILNRNVLSGRTFGEISFLNYFKFTTTLSGDYSNGYESQLGNPVIGDAAPSGNLTKQSTFAATINLQELLNYNQNFGEHHVSALVGHENYGRTVDQMTGLRTTQVFPGIEEFGNYTTTTSLTSLQTKDRVEGYFSNISYDFNEKYLFSISGRLDRSSRFSYATRDGYFGSVGAGWRLDKENFLKNVKWISMLKLRGSYGTTGNYQTLDVNGNQNYYPSLVTYQFNNNASESGLITNPILGNPDIKWEVNKTSDVALEFSLFNSRINGTIEYFNRQSSNLLFSVPLAVSSGYTSQFQNIGTMYNRGWEINLNGDVIRTKGFSWNLNVNATTFKNQITKMPEKQPEIISGTKKLAVGHSLYDFYLRQYRGVDPADGSSLYVPIDPTAAGVRTINGVAYSTTSANAKQDYTGDSAIPKVYGSINNTFTYKSLSLSILTNYQIGGKIYDSNYASLMAPTAYGGGLSTDLLKAWKNPGDITDVPRVDVTNSANLYAASSRWLTTASYFKIQNATLAYRLPAKVASKLYVKGINVYASGENIYLWAGRKGMDPTQGFNGTVSNAYLPSRVLSLGLNVTL